MTPRHRRVLYGAAPPPREVTHADPTAIRLSSGYGRLYIMGAGAHAASRHVAGAAYNPRRRAYEAPLTLASMRSLRQGVCGGDTARFSQLCEPDVLRWVRAASAAEASVTELHTRLDAGYRAALPWRDFTWREDGLDGPRAPFEHQRVMATAAVELDGVAYLCDVGTGKTRAACEALAEWLRGGDVDVTLVVCPKKVLRTWETQLDAWVRGTVRPKVVAKTPAKRREQVATLRRGDVLLVNYDVLKAVEAELARSLPATLRLGFVADEMHRLKNPHAQRTKAAFKVAQRAARRLGLTGSPILQGVQDVWSQWYVVDYGVAFGANYVSFLHEYTTTNPWTFEVEPRPGALDKASALLSRRGLRYRKEDCLDLPPRVYEVEDVDMGREQAAAYRKMAEDLVVEIQNAEEAGATATAANQLTVGIRLAQITSGFLVDEDGGVHRFPSNPKLDELETLVADNIDSQAIIVWAWFREDVRAICERLRRFNPVRLVGGQTSEESSEAEAAFQQGRARLMVANPAAGGLGINLQASSLAIYFSQWYNLEHRIQSEGRNHRSGSERHARVTYIDLACRGTVDELVSRALQRKEDVATTVTNFRRHIGL